MKKKNFIIILIVSIISFNSLALTPKAFTEEENKKLVICIDAGHQKKGDSKLENVSPNSSNKKPRVSQGTEGISSKKPEYVVNLEAAAILKDLLEEKGYNVIMTREEHDVNISNAERAEIANKSKANMTIRIHCDSLKDNSKTGATLLVPSSKGSTKDIFDESNKYAEILKSNLKENGVKVNGIFERNDITGFNWSRVPVVIFEMGFMSNSCEDAMLCDKNYQRKLMSIVADSIDNYKDGIKELKN